MKRILIGSVVVVAAIGAVVAFRYVAAKPARMVDIVAVERKEIHSAILGSGNFVFRQEVQLSSEVIGKVSEVLVKEGDRIEKGQVLLRLNPITYKAEVAQQEANRRSALVAIERGQLDLINQESILERKRLLMQAKFIGASQFDEAAHQVALAKLELRANREALQQATALLAQAQLRLAKTEVRAPISGTVTAVQIKVGETAVASATGMAGSSLMTIADVGSMMAEVNIDEADVLRVSQGQKARVFAAADANDAIGATVESVSMTPKVSTQGRSYIVKLRLGEGANALRTGMTCRAEIIVENTGARPVLPIQAIMTAEATDGKLVKNAKYVFAVVDGVARKKVVETGIADDTNQEIVKGLALGDRIVVGPARVLYELHDGNPVAAAPTAPRDDKALKVAGAGQ